MTLPMPLPTAPQVTPAQQPPGTAQAAPPMLAPISLNFTPEQKLELLEYWRSVTKRKWMILGLAVFAALLAGVVAMALTPIYRATTTLMIESGQAKILSIEDIYNNSQQREFYQSQVEILKSREVAERTVNALQLWEHPDFDRRKADEGLLARTKATLGIGRGKTTYTPDELRDAAVTQLMREVDIQPVRLSQLVKINVEAADPALAARIANTLAAQYVGNDRDARFKISQEVSNFLQERLSALRSKLTQAEEALQTYREKKGIVNLGGSAQTTAGQQVGGTNEKLTEARSRRLELESTLAQIRAAKRADYADAPAVMRDPAVAETLRNYNEANRKLNEAAQTLGPQHPRIRQLQSDLAQLSTLLKQQRDATVASLSRDYRAALTTETALSRALEGAKDAVQNVNREEFQLAVLEREAQTNRQLYDMFMNRAKETNLAADVQASVGRVVDKAVPPKLPVRPAKAQIVVVAAVLALFVGALASLLMDRLDNTVKGAEDAETRLRHPVLAAMPLLDSGERHQTARLFLDDPHSHFAESIRTARTGVLLSSLDQPHKILLVTSSLPGEGKTTLAINLALAHAQTKRTLLIDCDMRRAQVSRSLGIPVGTKGLTNLVADTHPQADCVFQVADSPLHVMPVGDLPPVPLELLLSQRFKDVLHQLQAHYEMVIIDSPPVELVSEALVLAPMATGIAFVVKAMSTPAPLARKSLSRLQRAGGTVFGLLVNHLDFEHAQAYYGEYSAASYGYGSYGIKPAEQLK